MLVAACVAVLASASAAAQEVRAPSANEGGRGTPAGAARKVAIAVRLEGAAPRIDGRLDDPAWQQARFLSDFLQKEPVEGGQPTVRTEVAILFDADAIYVGARMYGDTKGIRAAVTRRDNGGDVEHLWVSLDTYRDRRTAYSFGLTAAGTRLDAYHPRDNEMNRDASWDPVWEARARIDADGWTAELRIPFSQLRFTDRAEQVWGLNFDRWIPSRNEDIYWVVIPRSETGWSSRMGELRGIAGVRPPRRVELMPYVAGGATVRGAPDAANPFAHAVDTEARVGGDVKMGIGPNLTLEGTVNPDFGQVEADPAEVNLSAYETFFAERRPFFVEGSQLLRGDGPGYFYSRRIGAAPRVSPGGDYEDQPGSTTILGATKLSGRLASGLSIGGLAAVTGRAFGRSYTLASDSFGRAEVAPATAYGVLRARQEFGPWASTAGLILTAVQRDLPAGSPLADVLPRRAYTGGGDFNLRFDHGTYEVSGWAGFSYVAGDPLAMVRIQRSSAHLFQRPDARYISLDSARTSLSGYTANLRVARVAGRHWLFDVSGSVESPGLELNDIGQIQTADGLSTGASLRYRESVPGRLFRAYSVGVSSAGEWNFGGDRQAANAHASAEATFRNYGNVRADFDWRFRNQDERLTRGGPSMGRGRGWGVSGSVSNNHSAPARVSIGASASGDELGGHAFGVSGGLSVRAGSRLQLSVNPGYSRGVDPRQYVTTMDSGGPAETDGFRYVFAHIERSTLSLQFRAAYTVTPDLTIEAYAEPFATSGRYDRPGELAAPRSRELTIYRALTGPAADSAVAAGSRLYWDGSGPVMLPLADFNVRSFRSNVVVRWEWRPGSTLFLVWQQNRSVRRDDGALVRPRSLWDALASSGEDYFAVKISYWLPVR